MKIHDHGDVDSHVAQHGPEIRNPRRVLGHRLHRVGEMPVRREGLVTWQRGERVAMRVSLHGPKRVHGGACAQQEKHVEFLLRAGRRVEPWIVLPIVVRQLSYPDRDVAAPRAMPDVPEIRGEVARKEKPVRRGEYCHCARGRCGCDRPIPDSLRDPLWARRGNRSNRSRRVVERYVWYPCCRPAGGPSVSPFADRPRNRTPYPARSCSPARAAAPVNLPDRKCTGCCR